MHQLKETNNKQLPFEGEFEYDFSFPPMRIKLNKEIWGIWKANPSGLYLFYDR